MADPALKSDLIIDTANALRKIQSFFSEADSIGQKQGADSGRSFGEHFKNSLSGVLQYTIGNILSSAIQNGIGNIQGALASQIDSAKGLESTRLALNGVLGSAEKAGKVLKDVVEFASSTPFEIPEIANSAKQLAAFGFTADEIIPTIKRVGDVSSGLNVPIGEMAFLVGQIKTQGKAMTGDLNQFASRGVPIWKELTNITGKSGDALRGMAEHGQITSDIINQAFTNMSSKGGAFYQAMDIQSRSFGGRMSTLSDSVGGLSRKIIGLSDTGEVVKGGLFDTLSTGIQTTIDLLSSSTFSNFASKIGQGVVIVLSIFKEFETSIFNIIKLLYSGNFSGNIFGLGADSPVVGFLSTLRDSAIGVYDILFKGDFNNAVFGLQEDSSILSILFTIRDTAKGLYTLLFEGHVSSPIFGLYEDSNLVEFFLILRDNFLQVQDAVSKGGGVISETFKKFADIVGSTNLTPLITSIQNLIEGLSGLANTSLKETIEGFKTLFGFAIDNKDTLNSIFTTLGNAVKGVLEKGLPDLINKLADLAIWATQNKSTIENIAIVLGVVAGAILTVTTVIPAVLTAFATIGAILLTLDGIVAGVFVAFANFGAFVALLGTALGAGGFTAIIGSVISVLTLVFSPIVLIVAGIAALIIAGLLLWKNWDFISQKATELWSYLSAKFNEGKDYVIQTFNNIVSITTTTISNWINDIKNLVGNIKDSFVNGFNTIATTTSNTISNWITTLQNSLINGFVAIIFSVGDSFNSIKTTITNFINSTLNFFQPFFNLLKTVFEIGLGFITGIWNTEINAIATVGTAIFETIKDVIAGVFLIIVGLFTGNGQLISDAWHAMISKIVEAWSGIVTNIINNATAIWNGIVSIWNGIVDYLSNAMLQIALFINQAWNDITTSIGNSITQIKDFVSSLPDKINDVWLQIIITVLVYQALIWNFITTSWTNIVRDVTNFVTFLPGFIQGKWNDMWTTIGVFQNQIWNFITTSWTTIVNIVTSFVTSLPGKISQAWNDMVNSVKSLGDQIYQNSVNSWNNLINEIGRIVDSIKATVSKAWDNTMNFLKSIDLNKMGADIMQGLVDGITSMTANVVKAITGGVDAAIAAAKQQLGIHSPSKVFMEIGQFTGKGFMEGIASMAPEVEKAMSGLVTPQLADSNQLRASNKPSYNQNQAGNVSYSKSSNSTTNIFSSNLGLNNILAESKYV